MKQFRNTLLLFLSVILVFISCDSSFFDKVSGGVKTVLSYTQLNDNSVEVETLKSKDKTVVASIPSVFNGFTVVGIGKEAFAESRKLEMVYLPDSVEYISEGAFRNCINLIEIGMPETLSRIDDSCFSGCEKITKITLPEELETIGENVFSGCTSLERIEVHSSQIQEKLKTEYPEIDVVLIEPQES